MCRISSACGCGWKRKRSRNEPGQSGVKTQPQQAGAVAPKTWEMFELTYHIDYVSIAAFSGYSPLILDYVKEMTALKKLRTIFSGHGFLISAALLLLALLSVAIPACIYTENVYNTGKGFAGIAFWDWMYSPLLYGAAVVLLGVYCLLAYKRAASILLPWRDLLKLAAVVFGLNLVFNAFAVETAGQFPLTLLLTMACLCLGVSLLRLASFGVWLVVFVLSMAAHAAKAVGAVVDFKNLMEVFGTTWEDAKIYLSWGNVLLAVVGIPLVIVMYYFIYAWLNKKNRYTLGCTGAAALCLFLLGNGLLRDRIPCGQQFIWPLGNSEYFLTESIKAAVGMQRVKDVIGKIPAAEDAVPTAVAAPKDADIICILHIGESVRADHLSLNGWQHDTTPYLKSCEQLINYRDCVAAASVTTRAWMSIMTTFRRDYITEKDKTMLKNSPSLVDFCAKSGFSCATFWAYNVLSDSVPSVFQAQAKIFSRSAEKFYEMPKTGLPFAQLKQVDSYIKSKQQENKFILINNEGSHYNFGIFDKENAVFKPYGFDVDPQVLNTNPAEAEKVVNSYDNTIHDLDAYIQQLLEPLKGRPYLYIYVSDHGEYVGQEGYWCRHTVPDGFFHTCGACKVPFIVIYSPEFENLHPHFKEALAALRSNSSLLMGQEHIFHTLLGLLGIQTPYYDSSLDLTTPHPAPYAGPHP